MGVTTDESVSGTEEEGGRPEAGTAQPRLHTNSPTSQAFARSLGTSFRRVPSYQLSSFPFSRRTAFTVADRQGAQPLGGKMYNSRR